MLVMLEEEEEEEEEEDVDVVVVCSCTNVPSASSYLHRALREAWRPALAMVTVCCSITSWIATRSYHNNSSSGRRWGWWWWK